MLIIRTPKRDHNFDNHIFNFWLELGPPAHSNVGIHPAILYSWGLGQNAACLRFIKRNKVSPDSARIFF